MNELITEYLNLAYPIKRMKDSHTFLGHRMPTNGLKSNRKFKKVIIVSDLITLKISSDDKNMMIKILVEKLVNVFNIDRESARTFIIKHLKISER